MPQDQTRFGSSQSPEAGAGPRVEGPLRSQGTDQAKTRPLSSVSSIVLVGVAIVGLGVPAYFSSRAQNTASESVRAEQFSRSIEQLGTADTNVRVGALYSVGMLVERDSIYKRAGCEILGSYVAEHVVEDGEEDLIDGANWGRGDIGYYPAVLTDIRVSFSVIAQYCDTDASHPNFAPLSAPNVYLFKAHLVSTDLSGVNFRGAILDRANFQASDLRQASLVDARLREANFDSANLSGADLSGARLEKANFDGAILVGTQLSRARMNNAGLQAVDLSNADLSQADLMGAVLSGATLDGADLSYADLSGANLAAGQDTYGMDVEAAAGKEMICEGTKWPAEPGALKKFLRGGQTYCALNE